MQFDDHKSRPSKKTRHICILLFLFSLACAPNLGPLSLFSPTPTRPAVAIEVDVVYMTSPTGAATVVRPTITPPATRAGVSVVATSLPQPLPPTDTPVFSPTVTPFLTTPPPVTPTLTPTSTGTVAGVTAAPPLPNGSITLVELPDNLTLPADVGRVEFKWIWNEVTLCQPLPEGQGFEVRIWPNAPGAAPLGVSDAVASQENIICDPKSGVRSYEVGNLRSAPGVQAMGAGQFRWEVALIELTEPFTVVAVSESRLFQLPPDPATPTPTLTPVPRVTPLCPCQAVGGQIILIELQNEASIPTDAKNIEFKWRWTEASGCEQPPPGYGFEVRVWPDRPDFGPMGAMGDAAQSQGDIYCDPANGHRSYLVQNFANAPGIVPAGAGRFRWDVILFKQEPYSPVILSESRVFIIPGVSKLDQ